MLKEFVTALLFVESISKSKEWYTNFLGVIPIEEDDRFASFKVGSSFLNLHPADEKSPVSTGGCVVYWETDNFQEMISKAESLGGQIYRGPLKIKETGKTICQIKDPFGNVFGLEAET